MSDKNNLPPGWGGDTGIPEAWGQPQNNAVRPESASEPVADEIQSAKRGFNKTATWASDVADTLPADEIKQDSPNAASASNTAGGIKSALPGISVPKIPFPPKKQKPQELQADIQNAEPVPAGTPTAPVQTFLPEAALIPLVHTETVTTPKKKKPKTGIIVLIWALFLVVLLSAGVFFGYHYFSDGDGGEAPTGTSSNLTSSTTNKPADKSWKQLYVDKINVLVNYDFAGNSCSFSLVYIDDDDIPELIIDYPSAAAGGEVFTVYNNKLVSAQLARESYVDYIIHGNIFLHSDGNMGYYYDEVYSIQNGKFVELHRGEVEETGQLDRNGYLLYRYSWDGVEISENEYKRRLSSAFDESKAVSAWNKTYTYNEIVIFLGGTPKRTTTPTTTPTTNTVPDFYYAVVSTDGSALNLRSGPSTDFDIVKKIPNGCPIVINGYDPGWYEVSCYIDGELVWGFVSSEFVVEKLNWDVSDYYNELERFRLAGVE